MNKNKPNVNKFDSRLAAAYSQTENKEQQYDEWASTYEADLVDDLGYVAHKDASDIFAKIVTKKSTQILDVACGTGLVGGYLQSLGYGNVDGVDFSKEMLAVADPRQVYQATWQHDFTKPAKLDRLYEALICVGMFSYAVPKVSDMHNVVNCVVPSGICIITINGAAWLDLNLEDEVFKEAESHDFTVEKVIKAGYIENEGIDSRILVIKR